MPLLLWLLLCQQDLIHISDTHVTSLAGVHPDLAKARAAMAGSLATLNQFVDAVNQLPKATVVHTGDAVDAICLEAAAGPSVYGQIDLWRRAMGRLKHKYYLALGNHDVECYRRDPLKGTAAGDQSVADDARRRWRQKSYASRAVGAYRLILLDNGQAFETGGKPYFERQVRWLRAELRKRKNTPTLIALHIPLASDERSAMVLAAVKDAPQVKLVLCGHRHTDAVDWIALGERKLLQVRTAALFKGPGTWRRIRLWPDRVEVSATGEPERILETLKLTRDGR